jgi:hypothetical protein
MDELRNSNAPSARTPSGLTRRSLLKLGLAAAGTSALSAVLAACGDDTDDDASVRDDDVDLDQYVEEWLEEYDPIDIGELDVENQQAILDGETHDVWAYENTWVGEVTDDVFVAISIADGDVEGSDEVAAYACGDDDVSVYLTGELVNGEADLDDCIDKIQFAVVDDQITGTLTLEGGEPQRFVAERATGNAGLYRAETLERGAIGMTARWVVLADGRQRGGFKCRNPWTGDCMTCPRPK